MGKRFYSLNQKSKQDGHRTIVMDLHQHIRAEFTALGFNAKFFQCINKIIHQRAGDLRWGGVNKRRAVAFARISHQGELRNHNGFAVNIQNG